MSRNLRERLLYGVVCCHRLSDNPAFSLCKRKVGLLPGQSDLTNSWYKGDWTFISAHSRMRNLPLAPEVSPHNIQWYGVGQWRGCDRQDPGKPNYAKLVQPLTCIRTSTTRKAQSIINWRLVSQRHQSTLCLDNVSREVCCLLGTHIHHDIDRLPSLVKPANPFLLFHAGLSDVATRWPRNIQRNFMSFGTRFKGPGA